MLPLSWLQWIGHVLGKLWRFVQSIVEEKVGLFGGPIITLDNGMKVRRRHKLAEGGFSVVYLASGVGVTNSNSNKNNSMKEQYALKQIQCPDNETRSSCVREAKVHYDMMRAAQRRPQEQSRQGNAVSASTYGGTIMPLLGMTFVDTNNNHTSGSTSGTSVCYMCFPYYPHSLRQEVNHRVFDPITAYYESSQKQKKNNDKSKNRNSNHPMMRMSQTATTKDNEEEQIKSILRKHCPWPSVDVVLQMFLSLCDVVQEMHDVGYTHRDIKLENVLLKGSNNRTHLVSPVLMDLGSAGPLTQELKTRQDVLHVVDEASQHTTISYRPPELWSGELRAPAPHRHHGGGDSNNKYDDKDSVLDYTKVDVWMLGCVLFAILFGVSPYECEFSRTTGQVKVVETTHNKILADTIPWPVEGTPSSSWYPSEIKELIQLILHKDRHERPTLRDVKQRVQRVLNQHQHHHHSQRQSRNFLTPMSISSASSTGTASRSNSLGSVDLESQVDELLRYSSTSAAVSRHQ